MALKSSPFREGRPVSLSGAVASSEEPVKDAETPPEISLQAREHLNRIDKIAGDVLRDLQAVNDDIGKLREEIMLRARVLGEATLEFDELARTASQGYGSIRKAIEMVRQKFASAMNPTPTLPPPDTATEKNGRAGLVPDAPA